MSESTLFQLKIIVERVVRPVRASTSRKQKMREELLAHVLAVFEEEARRADEPAALEKTRARFGAAAEITAQLQATAPAGEAIEYYVERLIVPPGESVGRRAVRHAFIALLFGMMVFAIAWLFTANPREYTARSLLHLGAFLTAAFLLVFELYLLVEAMRRALYGSGGRSMCRACLVGAVALAVFPATIHFPGFLFGDGEPTLQIVLFSSWVAGCMVFLVAVLAHRAEKKLKYLEEWAKLPIE